MTCQQFSAADPNSGFRCRVEHHAAPALQQRPPPLDDLGDCSDKSCSGSPPAQLDQYRLESWPHGQVPPASAEPLQGHPRYSKVDDICR